MLLGSISFDSSLFWILYFKLFHVFPVFYQKLIYHSLALPEMVFSQYLLEELVSFLARFQQMPFGWCIIREYIGICGEITFLRAERRILDNTHEWHLLLHGFGHAGAQHFQICWDIINTILKKNYYDRIHRYIHTSFIYIKR